jgi:hypothetical protein
MGWAAFRKRSSLQVSIHIRRPDPSETDHTARRLSGTHPPAMAASPLKTVAKANPSAAQAPLHPEHGHHAFADHPKRARSPTPPHAARVTPSRRFAFHLPPRPVRTAPTCVAVAASSIYILADACRAVIPPSSSCLPPFARPGPVLQFNPRGDRACRRARHTTLHAGLDGLAWPSSETLRR